MDESESESSSSSTFIFLIHSDKILVLSLVSLMADIGNMSIQASSEALQKQ